MSRFTKTIDLSSSTSDDFEEEDGSESSVSEDNPLNYGTESSSSEEEEYDVKAKAPSKIPLPRAKPIILTSPEKQIGTTYSPPKIPAIAGMKPSNVDTILQKAVT